MKKFFKDMMEVLNRNYFRAFGIGVFSMMVCMIGLNILPIGHGHSFGMTQDHIYFVAAFAAISCINARLVFASYKKNDKKILWQKRMIFTASLIPFMLLFGFLFIFDSSVIFGNTWSILVIFAGLPVFMFVWMAAWSYISEKIAVRKINKKLDEQNKDEPQ
jgi:hypothetical protein